MPLSGISLNDINIEQLLQLIDDEIPEGKTIEYKRDLPRSTDGDKKEFLADVSSFSNTSGGDLILGMDEKDGKAGSIAWLKGINFDEVKLRFENLIRVGIKPRLPSYDIIEIKNNDNESVLILRMKRSWIGPHVVDYKGRWRFYARNSAGKYQLDVGEVKNQFLQSEELVKKIKEFRIERLGIVCSDESPLPVRSDHLLVAHLIPLDSFEIGSSHNLEILLKNKNSMYPKLYDFEGNRFNFDGLVGSSRCDTQGLWHNYCQIFRNGIIEYVSSSSYLFNKYNENPIFHHSEFGKYLKKIVDKIITIVDDLQVSSDCAFMVSLLNIKGFSIIEPREFTYDNDEIIKIEKNRLISDIYITERNKIDSGFILKPILETIWNACGYAKCWHYNNEGNWVD